MLFQRHQTADETYVAEGDQRSDKKVGPLVGYGHNGTAMPRKVPCQHQHQRCFGKLGGLKGQRANGNPTLGAATAFANEKHGKQKHHGDGKEKGGVGFIKSRGRAGGKKHGN